MSRISSATVNGSRLPDLDPVIQEDSAESGEIKNIAERPTRDALPWLEPRSSQTPCRRSKNPGRFFLPSPVLRAIPVAMNRRLRELKTYPMLRLDELKAAAIAAGQTIYDFGTGDPREPTPAFIREACREGLAAVSRRNGNLRVLRRRDGRGYRSIVYARRRCIRYARARSERRRTIRSRLER